MTQTQFDKLSVNDILVGKKQFSFDREYQVVYKDSDIIRVRPILPNGIIGAEIIISRNNVNSYSDLELKDN